MDARAGIGYHITMERIDRSRILTVRYLVQGFILALTLYSGWRFHQFVEHYLSMAEPVRRPPMVEGFLPIGGLMSLKLFLIEGLLDPVHPAAPVILASALLVSLALVKSFCGWICPVGTISEFLHKLGRRIFKRNFELPRWLDTPLRALKYVLLAFFLYIVAFSMSAAALHTFTGTPYWKVADVKMLFFFTKMSTLAAVVIGALLVLSVFVRNFWCRYLCPYGALTGLIGLLSPVKITRDESACIHCHACTRACPNRIDVESKLRVTSPECSGCMTCVSRCPARGALDAALPGQRVIKPMAYAAMVVVVFYALIVAAMATGHWQTTVTQEEYRSLIPMAERFEHP